jgi:hypothetical protein
MLSLAEAPSKVHGKHPSQKKRGRMGRKKQVAAVHSEPRGSISTLYQTKQTTTSTKSFRKMFDAVKPHEDQIHKLWGQHGHELGDFTQTRFEIGRLISLSMKAVRDAKFPGGYKAYHTVRNIPVPRQTCVRYAALYQDVASLHLKDEVLNAAFAAGIDLIKHVGKIKTAKTEVQQMDGPRFVAFLQHKPTRTQRPKLKVVADFVNAAMVAVAKVIDGIETDEEKNQAYAGVAYQISLLSLEAAVSGGEFTVKSPLAKDELEQLFHVREV